MQPSQSSPPPTEIAGWEQGAHAYLAEQLREAAPKSLTLMRIFERSPLEEEGATALFEFWANRAGHGEERYFVAVGQTTPNYYPAFDLDAEAAFALHLGTRFMLVMGISQVDASGPIEKQTTDYDPAKDARSIVDRVAPDKTVENVEVAATFDVDGQLHSVLRTSVAGETVYIMGRDAPLGFSTRTHLPPHVAYRIHLGNVLLLEAKPGEE